MTQTLPPDIVLVEDDPVDAKFFQRAVRKTDEQTRVRWLSDGQAAVDALIGTAESGEPLPRVIVLDIKLPRLRGFDVLQRLRADERTKRLPVIMLSSSTQSEDIERAYDLGANSYVSKPPTYGQLSHLVQQMLTYWLTLNRSVGGKN